MSDDDIGELITVFWVLVIGFVIGLVIGGRLGEGTIKRQAVERSAAHWKVSADGSTEFVWGKGEK